MSKNKQSCIPVHIIALSVIAGFACHWRECGLDALSDFVELVRHVYFHAFHVRIKSVGMSLILKNKLRGCQIDSVSRNMIPELPDKLHCSWVGCDVSVNARSDRFLQNYFLVMNQ